MCYYVEDNKWVLWKRRNWHVCCLLWKINRANPETCVSLLVFDSFLVTLSPLLFEYDLHCALCVLHDGCLDLDCMWWDGGAATEGVLAGADLVYFGEGEDVADLDVVETGDGEEVAGCQEVFSASYGCHDISCRLVADGGESVRKRGCGCSSSRGLCGLRVKRPGRDLAER